VAGNSVKIDTGGGGFYNKGGNIGGSHNSVTNNPPQVAPPNPPTDDEQRYQQLKVNIAKCNSLVGQCEQQLITSSDPREKLRLTDEIKETLQRLETFQSEISAIELKRHLQY